MSAAAFRSMLAAIVADDESAAARIVSDQPEVITHRAGANVLVHAIGHYVYGGDTALHIAAAAHRPAIVRRLISAGADIRARNRRGAEPLHYAADGAPGSPLWNATAQARTIGILIAAGADPNALDKSGVAPLHRAVRTRCAAAVQALLEGGADASLANKRGSTPLQLASRTTGRGGSGLPIAKAQQAEIARLLAARVSG